MQRRVAKIEKRIDKYAMKKKKEKKRGRGRGGQRENLYRRRGEWKKISGIYLRKRNLHVCYNKIRLIFNSIALQRLHYHTIRGIPAF